MMVESIDRDVVETINARHEVLKQRLNIAWRKRAGMDI
jgi:hypothetical protein